jgi:hypothetical protein
VNLYSYAGNNPIAYTDPFGLMACDPPTPECESGGPAGAFKSAIGKVVDKVVGNAPAGVDHLRREGPGTTRESLVDAVQSPPDLGSVDYSVTFHAAVVDLSVGTSGAVLTINTGIAVGVTADATYTAPGVHGFTVSASKLGGEGLIGGVSGSLTERGKFAGFSVSGGLGYTAPIANVPAILQVFGMSRPLTE